MLQAHPFQAPQSKPPVLVVKALERPSIPPAFNKVACLQLSRCNKCKSRNSHKISNMHKRIASVADVNTALQGLIRRLTFQLQSPGGGQALNRCIHDLKQVHGVELDIFTPAPWNQAVSPRFLRRLCKLYTASELIVDHQIPVLHTRHNVNRSPFQGELYVGDRFKCVPASTATVAFRTHSLMRHAINHDRYTLVQVYCSSWAEFLNACAASSFFWRVEVLITIFAMLYLSIIAVL